MAGKAGRSGGKRPGAGRKAKKQALTPLCDKETAKKVEAVLLLKPNDQGDQLLSFLVDVALGVLPEVTALQVKAAQAALPFLKHKLGEGGKKEAKQAAAERASGKFTQTPPPPFARMN